MGRAEKRLSSGWPPLRELSCGSANRNAECGTPTGWVSLGQVVGKRCVCNQICCAAPVVLRNILTVQMLAVNS